MQGQMTSSSQVPLLRQRAELGMRHATTQVATATMMQTYTSQYAVQSTTSEQPLAFPSPGVSSTELGIAAVVVAGLAVVGVVGYQLGKRQKKSN